MSVQDKVERVLRDFHVLFSRSEPYQQDPQKIIVSKQVALTLLNQLKDCMSEMMEEYEITARSRDKREREARKKGDEIIRDANRTAEDIYAASVMYSDEALTRIQNIIQDTNDEIERLFDGLKSEMKNRQKVVRENQLELKSSLEDLRDTDKYNKLIEERNKQIQKAKDNKDKKKEQKSGSSTQSIPAFPAGKPQIKINTEYFEKIRRPIEETSQMEPEITPEQKAASEMEIKVNLDAEYFRWKENQQKKDIT